MTSLQLFLMLAVAMAGAVTIVACALLWFSANLDEIEREEMEQFHDFPREGASR